MIRTCLLLLAVTLASAAHSQTLKEDLARGYALLKDSDTLLLRAKVFCFTSADKVSATKSATVMVAGSRCLTEFDGACMVVDGEMALMVNDSARMIFWQVLSKQQKDHILQTQKGAIEDADLEKAIAKAKNIRREVLGDSVIVYNMDIGGDIISLELVLDNGTGVFRKITYHYAKEAKGNYERVEINYEADFNPVFPADELESSKYLIKEGKTVKTTKAYEGYELYEIDFSNL